MADKRSAAEIEANRPFPIVVDLTVSEHERMASRIFRTCPAGMTVEEVALAVLRLYISGEFAPPIGYQRRADE